jgi:hypothetical protein
MRSSVRLSSAYDSSAGVKPRHSTAIAMPKRKIRPRRSTSGECAAGHPRAVDDHTAQPGVGRREDRHQVAGFGRDSRGRTAFAQAAPSAIVSSMPTTVTNAAIRISGVRAPDRRAGHSRSVQVL